MTPEISVVIPSFNDGKYLAKAVDSVKAQTFSNWEIVICDDGSTDGTSPEAAEALAAERIRVVRHSTNRGLAATRNTAIRAARAGIIVPLDADDQLPPDALALIAKALAEHPSGDFAFGHTREHCWEDGTALVRRLSAGAEFGDDGWMPWCGCSPFRVSLWSKVGGYDESELYRRAPEEIDFWMRVAAHKGRGIFIDAVLYDYLRRPGSLGHEFTPRALTAALNTLSKPEARWIDPRVRTRLGLSTALFAATYWRRRGRPLKALWSLRHGLRFRFFSWRLCRASLGCLAEFALPPLRRRYTLAHEAREAKAKLHAG